MHGFLLSCGSLCDSSWHTQPPFLISAGPHRADGLFKSRRGTYLIVNARPAIPRITCKKPCFPPVDNRPGVIHRRRTRRYGRNAGFVLSGVKLREIKSSRDVFQAQISSARRASRQSVLVPETRSEGSPARWDRFSARIVLASRARFGPCAARKQREFCSAARQRSGRFLQRQASIFIKFADTDVLVDGCRFQNCLYEHGHELRHSEVPRNLVLN